MLITQFSKSKIAQILDKRISFIKKRKIQNFLRYILFIIYFSIPSSKISLLQYKRLRITSFMEERALQHNLIFYPKQSLVDINGGAENSSGQNQYYNSFP